MPSHLIYKIATFFFATAIIMFAGHAIAQYPGFSDPGATSSSNPGGRSLIPVSPTVDGGSIPIGATAQVVVVFRNENGGPVSTGLIQLYPSSTVSAVVASNQCEGVDIPSGAECAVALSVKGLQSGQWRVEMLMAHSGRTRLTTATISGTVESSGENSNQLTTDVEAIPDALDFGTLNNSQTLVEPVILRNVTSVPIEISDIYIESAESAGYKLTTECEKLEAGQSCIATVSWSPQSSGRSSGVLVIKHSGPAALSSVPLKGEYEPEDVAEAEIFPKAVPGKGLLVASQSQIQFEESVSTASTITVSLVNAGDAPLTLNNIRFGGSDNGLSFKQEGCAEGITLDPIEACPLTVTWSPTRVGSLYDDVQIVHDGARGVLVLPVRGGAAEAVSQDQKAINLSEQITTTVIDPSAPAQENISESEDADIAARQQQAAKENAARVGAAQTKTAISVAVPNPASVLDGYKITSFSPSRAIINGPGGSRLVFDGEETVIGGVPWFIVIQKNGIEFLYQKQRILLLFDRSLSSVNRVTASSSGSTAQTTAANDT